MVSEIENWAFLFAENTRISLNTLMKDGKMDLRFGLFSSMGSELSGLQNVRIIRSKRVNELFRIVNEFELIPKEIKAIDAFRGDIKYLEEQIKKTDDALEKEDFQDEILTLEREIKRAQKKIQKAKELKKIDPREQPRDHLDREVLKKGSPIYLYEGDKATALIPYAVKKGCYEMSGCHKYAKEGEVLGAIRLEFSTKEINDQISRNSITTIQLGVVKFLIFLAVVATIVYIFVIKRFKVMQSAFEKVAAGDLSVRLDMDSKDELGILGESFNKMTDDLQKTTVSRDLLNKEMDERKEAEEYLQAAHNFLQDLINTIPNPIFYKEASGNYLGCNEAFEKFLGKTKSEIIGKTVYELAPIDLADKYCQMDKVLFEERGVQIYESKVMHSDGKRHNVIFNKATFNNADGSLGGIVGVIIDITDHKLIELDLKKAKTEAETANKAKSDFLANMSHELRTPLNVITGFSELLKGGLAGDMNDKQREFINDIHDSSHHLLALINDILDLSKIESGNMDLEISEVDLKELIERSHVFIKERVFSGKLHLKMEIEENVGVIPADKRLLKQVMINLLSNAAKFTPEGGQIRVVAKKGEDNSRNEPMIEIFVEDTGIGIKQEDLGKLFVPFKQIESVLTKKFPGTGLGLSICKDIVEMHGGRIWVESEWEKGSKFIFTLPISQE